MVPPPPPPADAHPHRPFPTEDLPSSLSPTEEKIRKDPDRPAGDGDVAPSRVGHERRGLLTDDGENGECRPAEIHEDEIPPLPALNSSLVMLVVTSSAAGFLFGYDTGVVSGALPSIRHFLHLSPVQEEAVVSSTVAACFLFSLIGGHANNTYGRRPVVLTAAAIFFVGAVSMGVAPSFGWLVAGRTVVGAGVGLSSLTAPMYVAECAPSAVRGRLVTGVSAMITVGQVTAGIVAGLLTGKDGGWRYMLGLATVPSAVMGIGFFFLPESPRWLAASGRTAEASAVLTKLHGPTPTAAAELSSVLAAVEFDRDPAHPVGPLRALVSAVSDPPTSRALRLGCGLMALQQLCGINTVMYYAANIYEAAGFGESAAVWLSAATALAQAVGVIGSMLLVERAGRRILVLCSLAGVAVSLLGLGFSFRMARVSSGMVTVASDECSSQPALVWSGITETCYDCVGINECGYCGGLCVEGDETVVFGDDACPAEAEWAFDACDNPNGWMSVVFMVLYLLSFGMGMGGMPWTITSEIYPRQHRSVANSLSVATNWLGNLIVSATFLTISGPGALTAQGAFWLYGCIAMLGFLWLYYALPETKGKSLEEIEELFRRPGDDGDDGMNESQGGSLCEERELL
mmetsp:Transcript_40924/g.80073  ORF Transcript_40924/g.80073 Transcript_40924/m.80073 type:complete len:630 (+) Transcript_40924:213-2102(+)|eukprot:CAMPEP_0194315176 /NCGR_PEP_ID=MMETSP0171-20130528/11967_1 /TAXON_ID=218684 /ORGANISM="Corethron pennatum, Strain L29A3" /LENGTH=629 /DNA_ID=CAMNT_0039070877 /DNA_START=122 /DNA_END=2011 /DNA_ORIENTATION=+